jgi:hypothetical protein
VTTQFRYVRAKELFGQTSRGQLAYSSASARSEHRRWTEKDLPSFGPRPFWPGVALLIVLTPKKGSVSQVKSDERCLPLQVVLPRADSDAADVSDILSHGNNATAC